MKFIQLVLIFILTIYINSLYAIDCTELEPAFGLVEKGEYSEAIQICERVFKSTDDMDLKGEALFTIAYSHKKLGNPVKALNYYLQSLEYYREEACKSKAYKNIGNIYLNSGLYTEAVNFYSRAINLKTITQTDKAVLKIYRGIAYKRNGEYERAIEDIVEAKDIGEQADNNNIQYKALNQLGLISRDIGNFDRSISYFFQAMGVSKAKQPFHNMGYTYKEMKDFSNAEKYFKKSLEADISPKMNFLAHKDLGQMFMENGSDSLAMFHLKKAEAIYHDMAAKEISYVDLFEMMAHYDPTYWPISNQEYKNISMTSGKLVDEYKKNIIIDKANDYYNGKKKDHQIEFWIKVAIISVTAMGVAFLVVWLFNTIRKRRNKRILSQIQQVYKEVKA